MYIKVKFSKFSKQNFQRETEHPFIVQRIFPPQKPKNFREG
jgi:hypothetical protein